MDLRKDLFKEICSERRGVDTQVLEQTERLAVEIAREERKIGTLFVVNDADEVLKTSRPLILDPLHGHSDEANASPTHRGARDVKRADTARWSVCSLRRGRGPLGGPLHRHGLRRPKRALGLRRPAHGRGFCLAPDELGRGRNLGELDGAGLRRRGAPVGDNPELSMLGRYSSYVEGSPMPRRRDELIVVSIAE